MIRKVQFYDAVRGRMFGGALSQMQVDQMESLIDTFFAEGYSDLRALAYILATVYHETGLVRDGKLVRTMEPVEEMGRGRGRAYGRQRKYNGQSYPQPHLYYGRGHTQNTWWETYNALTISARRQGKGWDFLNHPELLLQKEPSVWATIYAMHKGLYTSHRLDRYINDKQCDYKGARRIINGTDKADLIASYARIFYEALSIT